MFGSVLDMETIEKIKRQIKFVNQWYFIAITTTIVSQRLEKSDILKKATGKFVPWSEAKKWYSIKYYRRIKHSIRMFSGII